MTVTHKWSVTQLDTLPDVDGLTDVVARVHWQIESTDGTNTVTRSGIAHLARPAEGETFTAYADLTEATVLEWAWSHMVKDGVERQAEERLAQMAAPAPAALPWGGAA